MKEIRTIFIENKIEWNAPIIFVIKNDVVLLTPQTIIEKVFQINQKQKKYFNFQNKYLEKRLKKITTFCQSSWEVHTKN